MDQQPQQGSGASGGISSGFLRTKISLKGSQSQLSLVSPFYAMKPELPPRSQLLGSEDLISLFNLSGAYNHFCGTKKPIKEDLASFLPHVCGAAHINKKADSQCSLRKLIEDPPIMSREINNLSANQLLGFKLAPGPIPDSNRFFDLADTIEPSSSSRNFGPHPTAPGRQLDSIGDDRKQRKREKRSLEELTLEENDRKIKKAKGDEGGREKEKKRKKKEKKKKKDKQRSEEAEPKRQNAARETVTPFF